MDEIMAIEALMRLRDLARDGDLTGRTDLMDEVRQLKRFAEYKCKLDMEEQYGQAFAAASQAWFLVSGTGLPSFEDITYGRVIEHGELAISALMGPTSSESFH